MSNLSAFTQIALRDWILIIGLIFGGCCSNVFTLEKIITNNPESGNIVTFAQFLFISIEGYINFFNKNNPPFYLEQNKVPLKRWSLTIIMFFLISVLNNSVFIFKISIPIHIIFRSSGTAVVMIIGWLIAKKTYNKIQITSALLLTIGAIITTLYKDHNIFEKRDTSDGGILDTLSNDVLFFCGIGVLLFAAILMALLGLYNEETYKKYGKHWKENVFYSHLFGLPIFLLMFKRIIIEFKSLWEYPEFFEIFNYKIPKQIVYLSFNVLTQFFCVRGANMLAGNTTALTVSVVLLLRKFTSLLLSMWLFNNRLSATGSFGAFLVFFGAFLYSYGSKPSNSTTQPVIQDTKENIDKIELTELQQDTTTDDIEKAKLLK